MELNNFSKKKKKKKSLGLVKSGKFPYLDEIKFHSLKKLKIIITLYIKKKKKKKKKKV
jgi:hypothetical protein